MTTILQDESSIEDSLPREGLEISYGATRLFISTGTRDVVIGGNTYEALPAARSALEISFIGNSKDMVLKLPVSHQLPQRYMQSGVPPKRVTINVWRKQARSGLAEKIWNGFVISCAVDEHVASFLVPAISGEALRRRLPTITEGRACPYILYESDCRVPSSSFRVSTTVVTRSGSVVNVLSDGGNPDQWFQFGELVHVASGERMTINDHTGNAITIQLPIFELHAGDAVQLFPGCSHQISMCETKFANQLNFGGSPHLPTGNIFLPNGFGIYQSEAEEP